MNWIPYILGTNIGKSKKKIICAKETSNSRSFWRQFKRNGKKRRLNAVRKVGTLNLSQTNIYSLLTTSPSHLKDSMSRRIMMRRDLLFMIFNRIITTITTVTLRILRCLKVQVSPNLLTVRPVVLRNLRGRSRLVRRIFKEMIRNWSKRTMIMMIMGLHLAVRISIMKKLYSLVHSLKIRTI